MEDYEIIIIGAGMSGIDAAYRIKTQLPGVKHTILEARDRIGGTWSFFNFPGIRSDSSLTVFALPWRPWIHEKDIADASLIREYVESAARDEGIDKKIQLKHRVTGTSWSSAEQKWTLDVNADGVEKVFKASFIFVCSGYYDYEKPLHSEVPGIQNFQGTVAHPQFWPADLDYSGKKVVLVGSGATAVTILPEVAKTAGHITLLQRSPSYVFSVDSVDPLGALCKKHLPTRLAHPINRWRSLLIETLFVWFNLTFPNAARKLHMRLMRKQLPASVPVDVHFNPRYKPMEQRLCLCPDGDFFKALHQENCDIVTDAIDTVVADGIVTKSGKKLDADIIITATGLYVHLFGGMTPVVDGRPIEIGKTYSWRGSMLSGVPNSGAIIGYTTASWTLGADLCTRLLIRVFKHMKKIGATSVTPVVSDEDALKPPLPVVGHSSSYFISAQSRLPRVTGSDPWYGRTNWVYDTWKLWFGSITKGMHYTVPPPKAKGE